MRSFLSRYNSSQPGQASSQQPGQSQDMGWRALAGNIGSTVKRAAKSAYEGGYERMVTIRDSDMMKQWRERRNEEVKGVEKITLFPGYAVKRLHATRQNEFAIDIFVEGYASSLRPPELATRSQKAFMRLAKGFAALPKLPASDVAGGTLVPDVDDARSVRSAKDDESDTEDMPELSGHLPPRPDQMDDRLEEAALAHDPRAMNTLPGTLNVRPQDVPSSPATPASSLENLSHAELAILHANLDARLQPFWSSILPNRTVRISVFVSEHQGSNDRQSTTSSDSDNLKPVPLVVAEVQTNPQGYFSQRFNIPFDDICTHPPALSIAFGDPLVEHYLVIRADLLPVEPLGVYRPTSPLGTNNDARPPSPAISVHSTRSERTPQRERHLELPPSTSASFSAPATPPYPYQQPSASASLTSIRPPPSVQTRIPITSARVRLISDIDDTVKRTDVLLGVKAIYRNVFVKGLSDLIVPGMADWYSAMATRGVRFHYVSNSPFELLPVLQEFFSIAGLPHGSVRLRYYGGRSMLNGLWSGSGERKRAGIIEVLDAFADSQFILVGDTGEQDLELYATIARDRPEQILALFLRDVSTTGPPVDVFDPLRDKARLEESSEAGTNYFSPPSPTTSRSSILPQKVRDIPPPPVRSMSVRQGSMDYGSAQVLYRPRTPSRKSTINSEGGPLPSSAPATRPEFSTSYTSEPQEARTPSPYAMQTRTSPIDTRIPSQRLPGAYGPPRTPAVHRSSTSMSSTSYAQDSVYDLEERRRNELRARVQTARQLTPAHILIKIFREPADCNEVFKLLDNLGLKGKPRS